LSFFGLVAAAGVAAPATLLSITQADAQTAGMDRREDRRDNRQERRTDRRTKKKKKAKK
jgi:hypothetical protein